MRRYEVVYVAFDDLSAEDLDSQLERYLSIVSDYKGTIVKVERWGKRRLAYQIQKRREGHYFLIDFAGDSAIVPEMERRMRIDDKLLRYISVKTDDEPDPVKLEEEIAAIKEAEARKLAAAAEAEAREAAEREAAEKAAAEKAAAEAAESVSPGEPAEGAETEPVSDDSVRSGDEEPVETPVEAAEEKEGEA